MPECNYCHTVIPEGYMHACGTTRAKSKKDEVEAAISQNNPEPLKNLNSWPEIWKAINELRVKMKEVERFQDITHKQYLTLIKYRESQSRPHLCPVCDGLGNATKFLDGKCHPCEGKGVLWG